ncbi:MAG TPA: hypothetical protein DD667_09395, partial [Gammaproteobacteria bacterium]|nr:hypothetical protein [Gammaproteobacteria bacterium]
MDIRTASPIVSGAGTVDYIGFVSDCSQVSELSVGGGSEVILTLAASDAERSLQTALGCEVAFSLSGSDKYNPGLTVSFVDGASRFHQEMFAEESIRPALSVESVAIAGTEQQQLVVTVKAVDDSDISYLAYDIVGLRGSQLQRFGGVVDQARESAFARTERAARYFPMEDTQELFDLVVPLAETLSAAEIASDGVVLVEVTAVDSSGNQRSISQIALTGDSVKEDVLGLTVKPENLIFNSALEIAQIIPSVEFQFRGLTPLPGYGSGVTYVSTEPDFVQVTPDGFVYPIKETGATPVFLQVSYPGTDAIQIPVEVDYSKTLVGLTWDGAGGSFELLGLNQYHGLPELFGVFDDGSTAPLNRSVGVVVTLPQGSESVLRYDAKKGLFASSELPQGLPVSLSLDRYPDVTLEMPVVATDVAPEISMKVPARVEVGSTLVLNATPTDDVGIGAVEFVLDGNVVGRREAAPYELSIPLSEELKGRTIYVAARATDTKGQSAQTEDFPVSVVGPRQFEFPEHEMVLPVDGARIVEGSPFVASIDIVLGELPDADPYSGVSRVEFYADGQKIGDVRYPILQQKSVKVVNEDTGQEESKQYLVETWRINSVAPEISTDETSRVVSATLFAGTNSTQSGGKQIRIVKNSAPVARVLTPVAGALATVGQVVDVKVEAVDDSLAAGTTIELMVNGAVVDGTTYRDTARRNEGIYQYASHQHVFSLPITESMLGQTLELQAQVTDYHEKLSRSEIRRLPVKADQAPTVAVSYPAEGASLVSGLPVELRANASDDLGVSRVDFFVNDQLVGSDSRAPFATIYQTPQKIANEQPLAIVAVATDSEGKSATSEPVNVTLGKDETAPVLNLASPFIDSTDAGSDVASVLEESEFVLKVTGYDNVGVASLRLQGVRKVDGQGYVLTGDPDNNEVPAEDFVPQVVPGALNAFSALKLVSAPAFKNLEGVEYDSYEVRVTAVDEAGNSSQLDIVVGVYADRAPEIKKVSANKPRYFVGDTIVVETVAQDDRAVSALTVNAYIGGAAEPALTVVKNAGTGLAPAADFVDRTELDLASLALPNTDADLRIEVQVADASVTPKTSQWFVLNSQIQADLEPPKAALISPPQGSTLYHGQAKVFRIRAIDNSLLQSLSVTSSGSSVLARNLAAQATDQHEENFTVTIPDTGTELVLEVSATDIYGNTSPVTNWRYELSSDLPPTVSIRTPAAGSRLTEGESITLNALVADDRKVTGVTFFVRLDGAVLQQKTVTGAALAALVDAGKYVSAVLNVPTRPETGELEIGVSAVDSSDQVTTALLDMEILDDQEAPTVSVTDPNTAFSILPGNAFTVAGSAADNIYVNAVQPLLVAEDGSEIELAWEMFARNDRQDEVRVANPGSLGSIVVAKRFATEFKGRVRIPAEFSQNYGGQTFDLVFQAEDMGVNEARSVAIPITILADNEGPEVVLVTPEKTLYDRQSAAVKLTISDNVAVASYLVELLDDQGNRSQLGSLNGLNEALLQWPYQGENNQLNLEQYAPVVEERSLTLVVTSSDLSGNQTIHNERLVLKPDQAPVVSIEKQDPESSVIKGQLAKTLFLVEDDYIVNNRRNKLLALYTSLTGVGAGGSRDPTGLGRELGADEYASAAKPVIAINYPEAQGWNGSLAYTIAGNGNRSPYLEFEAGQAFIHALPENDERITGIGLVSATSVSATYTVTLYSDNACSAEKITQTIDSGDGWLDLSNLVDTNTVAVKIGVASPQAGFLQQLWINYNRNKDLGAIALDTGSVKVDKPVSITAIVEDGGYATAQPAIIHSGTESELRKTVARAATAVPAPNIESVQKISVLAHATDRMSHERAGIPLRELTQKLLLSDTAAPSIDITTPQPGTPVIPGQRVPVGLQFSDNTSVLESIQLLEDGNTIARELGIGYGQTSLSIPYNVPADYQQRELRLTVIARDLAGNLSEYSDIYPVEVNEPPLLDMKSFSSYKVQGKFQTVLTSPQRLNYGEFWVRVGEDFELKTESSDDAGLQSVAVYRLARDGSYEAVEYLQEYDNTCPNKPVYTAKNTINIPFLQAQPTEYKVVVTDTVGQTETRTFLVHPLANMAPEIRITSPADAQQIAAGTFLIKVGVVASDDRKLVDGDAPAYGQAIKILANGVPLSLAGDRLFGEAVAGGQEAIEQAYASIYDAFEESYGPDKADQFGNQNSPYAVGTSYLLAIPDGVVRDDEPLTITAYVYDSDNSVGIHEITINVAPDTIKPVPVITRPELGYGAVENSDFTLGFSGFDNVKVQQLEVDIAYGINDTGNNYQKTAYQTVRTVSDIPSLDYQPVSTVNIDAPEYLQLLNVPRLQVVRDMFPAVALEDIQRFDIWVRVTARDVANEESTEISFPIRVDERPVIDIIDPLDGHKAVEETQLWVNVNAFDDVGLDYVKLTATYRNGQTAYEMRLRQPPYNYLVPMPVYDPSNGSNNIVDIQVEALDT